MQYFKNHRKLFLKISKIKQKDLVKHQKATKSAFTLCKFKGMTYPVGYNQGK